MRPATRQRRLAAAFGLPALIAVAAGCGGAARNGLGASGDVGAAAGAFPAATLAFADADQGAPGWQRLHALLARFPSFARAEAKLQTGSLARDVKPWFGGEAAVGVLGVTIGASGPKPQVVGYVASKDDAAARSFLTGPLKAKAAGAYKGYDQFSRADRDGGSDYAAVGHGAVLLANDRSALQQSIDAREGAAALADTDAYRDTLARLPSGSTAFAFVDTGRLAPLVQLAGMALLARHPSDPAAQALARATARLKADRALGLALAADEHGLRLRLVELPASGSAVPRPAAFTPSLLARAPSSAIAFGTLGDASRTIADVLQAVQAAPEAQSRLRLLESRSGLDVGADLTSLLDGESALYVGPGASPAAGVLLKPRDAAAAAATMRKLTAAAARSRHPLQFQPLPGVDGQTATAADGTVLAWRRDGGLIDATRGAPAATTSGGLADNATFRRLRKEADIGESVTGLAYLDVPTLVARAGQKASHMHARARADLLRVGPAIAFGEQADDAFISDLYVEIR